MPASSGSREPLIFELVAHLARGGRDSLPALETEHDRIPKNCLHHDAQNGNRDTTRNSVDQE
jgi:hypothetical protein